MNKTNGKLQKFKNKGKYCAMIGLFISAIAFVHFSLQIDFIQKVKLRSIETSVEVKKKFQPQVEKTSPVKQIIEVEPEQYEVKQIEVITIPERVKPAPRRQKETISPPQKPVRKKEIPETRAERLRRAERILTGV